MGNSRDLCIDITDVESNRISYFPDPRKKQLSTFLVREGRYHFSALSEVPFLVASAHN